MGKLTESMRGQHTVKPICIDPKRVIAVWPYVEGFIDKAMRRNDISDMTSVRDDVLSGHALLWITWNGFKVSAALVTKIIKPYDTKICILVACGGEGNWPVLIETIEDYARSQDCAISRIYGPAAWGRVLKDYRISRVLLDKEL